MTDPQIIEQLNRIEAAAEKTYLAALNEQSASLLDTAEIAKLCGRSYDYTYKFIVSDPEFPKPCNVGCKRGKASRRWIAGEVVAYIKTKHLN